MTHFPPRQRPDVKDELARRVLDWVETGAYVFWVLFSIAVAVIVLIHATDAANHGLELLNQLWRR